MSERQDEEGRIDFELMYCGSVFDGDTSFSRSSNVNFLSSLTVKALKVIYIYISLSIHLYQSVYSDSI